MHGVTNGLTTRRTRARLTQQALAEACDVSVETIRAMEGGRRFHGPGAQRVADYFGVDLDVLYMSAITPEKLHPRMVAQLRPSVRPVGPEGSEDDRAREIVREVLAS
jgi:transcriptional regulator with XRE-family HTH domain